MIKYCLICKNCDLTFESWFASSKEYEKLKKKNFLSCHNCSSKNVEKSLMAPNLINNKTSIKANKEFKKYNQIKKKIFEYQKFIKDNLKYVGDNFAHEARTIHYNGKKQNKGIYGTASNQDLKELKEEGIDAQIIPWVDDKNN
tara:strand:- start:721 stop:1149 length:429 start_codon:yes stop_codon:yes gene_type:complete